MMSTTHTLMMQLWEHKLMMHLVCEASSDTSRSGSSLTVLEISLVFFRLCCLSLFLTPAGFDAGTDTLTPA